MNLGLSLGLATVLDLALCAWAHSEAQRHIGIQKVPRLVSYLFGSTLIGGTWTAWALWMQPALGWLIAGFWLILLGAGIGTGIGWLLDLWTNERELQARRKADHGPAGE